MATHLRNVHQILNEDDIAKAMSAGPSKPRDRFKPAVKCSLCGKKFDRTSVMVKHMAKVH